MVPLRYILLVLLVVPATWYAVDLAATGGKGLASRFDVALLAVIWLGFLIWFIWQLYDRVMARLGKVETLLRALHPARDGAVLDPEVVDLTRRIGRKITDSSS